MAWNMHIPISLQWRTEEQIQGHLNHSMTDTVLSSIGLLTVGKLIFCNENRNQTRKEIHEYYGEAFKEVKTF
jgi:hypothetical protein